MTYLVEGAYVFICLLDDWQQTIEPRHYDATLFV